MVGTSLQAKNNIRIIFAFVFFLAPLTSFSNDYDNKSLLCSTKSHLVKGGFIFTNDQEVDKFNILMSHNGLKTIKRTSHCYLVLEERILISDKNPLHGCGRYSSFIDLPSLIYNIPSQDKILSANCRFYNDDLLLRLEQSIRE